MVKSIRFSLTPTNWPSLHWKNEQRKRKTWKKKILPKTFPRLLKNPRLCVSNINFARTISLFIRKKVPWRDVATFLNELECTCELLQSSRMNMLSINESNLKPNLFATQKQVYISCVKFACHLGHCGWCFDA